MDISIFRAYDIRGEYPRQINENVIKDIAPALAKILKRGLIIIGHDARLSSPKLYAALLEEFKTLNLKFKILGIGLTTTPMFYFLVNKLKANGGIMVTASHNPPDWNGLKVVGKRAQMISGKDVLRIMN